MSMEIKKPQPFSPEFEEIVQKIKGHLEAEGLLSKHPVEHHNKIAKDYTIMGAYVNQLPEEGNSLLEHYKHGVFAGYFTLLQVTQYQIDVEHFIGEYQLNFQNLMEGESVGGMLLKATSMFGDIMDGMTKQVMAMEMLQFIHSYSKKYFPEIVARIEAMNETELQDLLNKHNIEE